MAKSRKKQIEKIAKKVNPFVLLLFVIIFAGFVAGGYFLSNNMIKNDTFELIGDKTIQLSVGQTYTDEGAKAISFGKDISHKIVTENNIDFSTAGNYYIKYTVDDIRFKDVVRYRTIIVVEEVGNE